MIPALTAFLQQAAPATADSIAAAAPAIEPTARMFRFLFSTVPQWVQIAGVLIGVPVAGLVAWKLWKNRARLIAWFKAQSRGYKIALASLAVVLVAGAGTAGLYNYHYVMHDNDFCASCHIMDNAWNRFQSTAHRELSCHSCHRQSMLVSTKELFWWVYERRMAVPAHDKVPTAICSECHLQRGTEQQGTDTMRTNVLRTAGHVVHLQSDSTALKDVQCVSCHGRDFHMFQPNNATCAQSGCHTDVRVKLGAMSNARFLHCTTCHQFRTPVPEGQTVADARTSLSPRALGCSACHQMADRVLQWDLAQDPHKGQCGSCHNPHKQEVPRAAFESCATSGCHAQADTLTAFHRGLGTHKLDDCAACHQAHSWKVKGNDCLACHKTIYDRPPPARRGEAGAAPSAPTPSAAAPRTHAPIPTPASRRARHQQPAPAPDDGSTIRPIALRSDRSSNIPGNIRAEHARRAVRLAPAVPTTATAAQRGARVPARANAPADSVFDHRRHRDLACTQCHATTASHGAVTITAPRDCQACHHGRTQKAECRACHATATLVARPQQVALRVSARKEPGTVMRTLPFAHDQHTRLECGSCHGTDEKRGVTATCASCHADHHQLDRDCAACHTTAKVGHDRTAHDGCISCHTAERFAPATPSRQLCLGCHQEQRTNHYAAKDCVACHAVASHAFARPGGRGGAPR